jgi:hypothetical protein
MHAASSRKRKLVWLAVGLLFVLHHDFWFWNDPSLVLGFLPIGLAYHLLFSVAAGGVWFAMVKFAWPSHVEEFAEGENKPGTRQVEKPL